MQGESVEKACPAFKGCLAHEHSGSYMCKRAYVAVSCIGDVTMMNVDHKKLEDTGWIYKLLEYFSAHTWP